MSSIIKVQNIQYTDGDAALTIADGGGVTAASTLTSTGAFTSPGIDDNADATTMTIDTSENVGIGNTSPSSQYMTRLVVGDGSGTEGITIYSGNDSMGRLEFSDATSGDGRYAGGVVYEHNNNKLRFNTNGGNERLSIDSNGYVNISQQPSISVDGDQNSGASIEAPSNVTYHTITEYSTSPANFYGQGITYNNINGRFTVPKAGKYLIGVSLYAYSNNKFMRVRVEVNDTRRTSFTNDFRTGDGDLGQDVSISGTCLLNLSASDYITFRLYVGNTSGVKYGRWQEHHGAFIHLLS